MLSCSETSRYSAATQADDESAGKDPRRCLSSVLKHAVSIASCSAGLEKKPEKPGRHCAVAVN